MSFVSIQDVDTLLNWVTRAKAYLEGDPFTVRIYNYNVDFVTLDSYVLDSRQKASQCILPELVISRGSQSTAGFKANLFSKSESQYLFKTRYQEVNYEVLLTYKWQSESDGEIVVLVTDLSQSSDSKDSQTKSYGGFFKEIVTRHSSGLVVTAMANGPILQIGFGSFDI